MRFEWDPHKAALNKAKHDVSFEQAITAFDDPDAIEVYDNEHSQSEHRYKWVGRSDVGVVIVVYTFRHSESLCRIIHARKATRQEKKIYYG